MKYKQKGFTLVEVLIVIAVIGVLAGLVYGAYNNREQVKIAQRESDYSALLNAIKLAHLNSESKTLEEITGYNFSGFACRPDGDNPGNVEPKNLPKTHLCWTRYYEVLQAIDTASGEKLYEQLKDGDPNGNPYMFDENEGEYPEYPCRQNYLFTFVGNGTADWTIWRRMPFTLRECQGFIP